MSGDSGPSENERRFFAEMHAFAQRGFSDSARRALALRVLADPASSARAKALARRIVALLQRADDVAKFLGRRTDADE